MPDLDIATLQKKVRRIEIVSNRLVNDHISGAYHSVFKGQGIEFEEVRPYIVGDDIRSIDWNVTARAGEPHIKRFREEREQTVFFVVDLSGSCQFGTQGEFKSERMAELTAVLSLAAIANNDRAGLMIATDRLEQVIPPRKGRRHVLRMVREVLAHQPQGTGTNLALALDHLRYVLNRRAVVFVISDFLTAGYERALATVGRRHDVIAVSVEDPLERTLPPAGLIEVMDGEGGGSMVIDTASLALRARFAHHYGHRHEECRKLCRKHEIDLIELSTDRAYDTELVQFFRRRERRQSRG